MTCRAVCFALLVGTFVSLGGAYPVGAAEEVAPSGTPRKLESLLGRDVSTRPDGDGGRIVDILIDGDGTIRAAVVEFGGFLGIGTRKIAVEWDAFRVVNGAIVADVTRDKLRAAKEYKPNEPAGVVEAVRD